MNARARTDSDPSLAADLEETRAANGLLKAAIETYEERGRELARSLDPVAASARIAEAEFRAAKTEAKIALEAEPFSTAEFEVAETRLASAEKRLRVLLWNYFLTAERARVGR